MILSFSQKWPASMGKWAGQPTYFVEKVLKSLPDKENYYPALCGNCGWKGMSSICGGGDAIADTGDYSDPCCPKCERETINDYCGVELLNDGYYQQSSVNPKLHTIRAGNRWEAGMDIHFAINPRSKNYFQFAPVMECTSVQEIELRWWKPEHPEQYINDYDDASNMRYCDVYVDGKLMSTGYVKKLAQNDGFDSVEQFFAWFNKDFKGQLIHWSDLRY